MFFLPDPICRNGHCEPAGRARKGSPGSASSVTIGQSRDEKKPPGTASRRLAVVPALRAGPQRSVGARLCAQHFAGRCDVELLGTRSTIHAQVDTKNIDQPRPSCRGQPQRAGIALPGEPAECETPAPTLRAHQTGDVIAALAPIEAGPAEDALAARAELRAESGQETDT